jgi:hypothetical protein
VGRGGRGGEGGKGGERGEKEGGKDGNSYPILNMKTSVSALMEAVCSPCSSTGGVGE